MRALPMTFGSVLLTLAAIGCPGDTGKESTGTEDSVDTDTPCDEDGDGYCVSDGDCDESDPNVNPGVAEECDGIDNNCNDAVDEGVMSTFYTDGDGDGYGDSATGAEACEPGQNQVSVDGDCDDANDTVFPDAAERCDGLDNDCDGDIDEEVSSTWYADNDGDGYGDDNNSAEGCDAPEGWVAVGGDCNDNEALAWTGHVEECDGVDNDCNGEVDEGLGKTYYADNDGDGYGDPDNSASDCAELGDGWVGNSDDCDDAQITVYLGATEYCDDLDNDCNGLVDDSPVDSVEGPTDADGDGFGDATSTSWSCDPADNTLDCNDADPSEPQVADAASTSGAPDGSMADPWATIQDAMDNATECVAVVAGVYTENLNFNGSNLSVFSMDGAEATIIDGSSGGSVVSFSSGETSGAELSGFTLMSGTGTMDESVETTECGCGVYCVTTYQRYYGGGIFVDGASPTLWDLIIESNELPAYSYTEISATEWIYVYSYGGGMFVNDSAGMTPDDLWFEGNWAMHGGGLYAGGTSSMAASHATFAGNGAEAGGGVASVGGILDLSNSVIAGNSAYAGGGVWADGGSGSWWNNDIAGNTTSSGGSVAVTGAGSLSLYSTAVTNETTGWGIYVESGSTLATDYCNVYGNAAGDWSGASANVTDISADPMYNAWSNDGDYTNDDFSLAAGSAMIDAGNPSAAYNDVDGSTNDIGSKGGPGGE